MQLSLCIWDGSEKEIREFLPAQFMRMQDENALVQTVDGAQRIRLQPGDYIFTSPADPAMPALFFFADEYPWLETLFQREGS
jgi:hypothetical protein